MLKFQGFLAFLLLSLTQAVASPLVGVGSAANLQIDTPVAEQRLLSALERVQAGEINTAMQDLDVLTREHPNFRLAQAVKADLLLAKAQVLDDVAAGIGAKHRSSLVAEARARFLALRQQPEQHLLPGELLKIGADTRYVVLVEKSRNRLFLYERDRQTSRPSLVYSRYTSTGRAKGDKQKEGDLKTPEGVYFISRFIPDRKLAEKYGRGALTLNYPNELDRRLGKTGHGIWIHGLEGDRYSRPPLDSEGCVVLPNDDFLELRELAVPGNTPVVIAESVDWLDPDAWQARADLALLEIEQWRTDWESLDVDRYLSHYANNFWAKGHDLRSWSARKRRVASRKQFQSVSLENLTLLAYPQGAGAGERLMVSVFKQRYRSNNYNSDSLKRVYWTRADGDWKIRYEGELND